MTSTEEIAPERSVAAVSNADHCQIGPLGGRSLADLCDAALLGAKAPALLRPEIFIVDFFFGAGLLKTLFLPIAVFLATSHLSCPEQETVRASRPAVEMDDCRPLRVGSSLALSKSMFAPVVESTLCPRADICQVDGDDVTAPPVH